MKRIIFLLVCGFIISLSSLVKAQGWALKANIAESCACDPACPCLFGSDHTHDYCHANMLVQIEEGHYNGVNLDGLDIVFAYSLDGWSHIYVKNNATEKQVQAAQNLIPLAFNYEKLGVEVKSVQKSKVKVNKSSNVLKYSTPFSSVAIERMVGPNGKPIKIQNLIFPNYTQYESIKNSYNDKGKHFDFSETNGFTATIDVSNED